MNDDMYTITRKKAYSFAAVVTGEIDPDKVWAKIMKDSDSNEQAMFLMGLTEHLPSEKHRQILLDGLAKEFTSCKGWMEYVKQECG
jgi:hypothetical protein